MKKIILIIILLIVFCTACNADFFHTRLQLLNALTDEDGEKIDEMSSEIIRCFTERDKEALKELFCEVVRNTPDFDDEIEKAFEYFECDGFLWAEKKLHASGGNSWSDGRRVKWYLSPIIHYISVRVGSAPDTESRYYAINYFWYIINEEDESLEGLHYINIELLNVDSFTLGSREHRGY